MDKFPVLNQEDGVITFVTAEELSALIPHPEGDGGPGPDVDAPTLTISKIEASKNGALIEIVSDEPCEVVFTFGLSEQNQTGRVEIDNAQISHVIRIDNLEEDTEYFFFIRLEDVHDNFFRYGPYSVKTLVGISDPPADHVHYEQEKAKAGVMSYSSYRVEPGQTWVEEFPQAGRSWDEVRGADPGDANYPFYDAAIDGLKLVVRNGAGDQQTQIRREFPETRIDGHFWSQCEIMPSEDFLNVWDGGFKLFRWEDESEGVGDKRVLTLNCGAGNGENTAVYHRDGEKVLELNADGTAHSDEREVRVWYAESPPTIDEQPGGDTQVWREGRDPLGDGKPGFYWSGSVWHRLTWHLDFVAGKLEVWAQKLSGSDTSAYKIIDFPVAHWKNNSAAGVSRCGMWNHSTSGVTGPGTTFWGYRNLIVSRQPISL